MNLNDLWLILAAVFSEVVGTLSGFGSSTFFVPIASYFEDMHFVLVLTGLLHCFGNFSKFYLFRESFDRRLFLRLAIPAIVLTAIGAQLNPFVPVPFLRKALGVGLILVALLFLFGRAHLKTLPLWAAIALSSLSGFMTGLIGTGGAIRGVAMAGLRLEAGPFILLSSAIDFGGDLIRTGIYIGNGFMDWTHWFYIPFLALAAVIGANLGKYLLGFINQEQFEKIVSVFVLLAGAALLF